MGIGWLPLLIYLIWWIWKRRPYARTMTYRFPMCGFVVRMKRW
jgi:hypothetical protein